MTPELATALAPVLVTYFEWDELRNLASMFDVELRELNTSEPSSIMVATELTANLDHGNNRRFLDNLLEMADFRNAAHIAHTKYEQRDLHYKIQSTISKAKNLLEESTAPSEIAVPAGNPFSAKSKVRELLETATGDVFIVDPYIGVGTLDCLRSLTAPIRLLSGTHTTSIEPGFEAPLAAFVSEGHHLSIRRAPQLHDRHIFFNDRLWIIGGSLKDAGKKAFHCIEITDKTAIVADLENKWQHGAVYP